MLDAHSVQPFELHDEVDVRSLELLFLDFVFKLFASLGRLMTLVFLFSFELLLLNALLYESIVSGENSITS